MCSKKQLNGWFCTNFTFRIFRACLQLQINFLIGPVRACICWFGPDLVAPFTTLFRMEKKSQTDSCLSGQNPERALVRKDKIPNGHLLEKTKPQMDTFSSCLNKIAIFHVWCSKLLRKDFFKTKKY